MVWVLRIAAGLALAILFFLIKTFIRNYRLNNFTVINEYEVTISRITGISSFIEYFWNRRDGSEAVKKISWFKTLVYMKCKPGSSEIEWKIFYCSIFSPKETEYSKLFGSPVVFVEEIDYYEKKILRYYIVSEKCEIKAEVDGLYDKTKKRLQPIFEKASLKK